LTFFNDEFDDGIKSEHTGLDLSRWFFTWQLLRIGWRFFLTDKTNMQTFSAKNWYFFVTVCQIDVKKLQILLSAFKMARLQITKLT